MRMSWKGYKMSKREYMNQSKLTVLKAVCKHPNEWLTAKQVQQVGIMDKKALLPPISPSGWTVLDFTDRVGDYLDRLVWEEKITKEVRHNVSFYNCSPKKTFSVRRRRR